jgi:hypothetical protein
MGFAPAHTNGSWLVPLGDGLLAVLGLSGTATTWRFRGPTTLDGAYHTSPNLPMVLS